MSLETDIKQKKFRNAYQKLTINLKYTSNWLGYRELELFKENDLTSQQYNVLRILKGQPCNAVKVSDIAERMLDKNSNASRLLDKLLAKNLVKRTSCPNDRRAVDVVITEEGLELLDKMEPALLAMENNMSSALTEEEAELLSNLLDKLRKSE